MALDNSRRILLVTTHCDLDLHAPTGNPESPRLPRPDAPLGEQVALLSSFGLLPQGIEAARKSKSLVEADSSGNFEKIFDVLTASAGLPTGSALAEGMHKLSLPAAVVASFARALLAWQRQHVQRARENLREIVEKIESLVASVYVNKFTQATEPPDVPEDSNSHNGFARSSLGNALDAAIEQIVNRAASAPFSVRLTDALANPGAGALRAAASEPLTHLRLHDPRNFDENTRAWKRHFSHLAHGIERLDGLQPLGYLHLERMVFTPAGEEPGELVATVPLSPGESVYVLHKEWTTVSEEFSRLVSDEFEEFSEKGVVEKTELSSASSSQSQHSSNLSVAISVSGGLGKAFHAGSSTSYQTQESSSQTTNQSLRRSREMTQKASSRAKREHRVSFRIAKKSHVEDETVRRLRNPDPIHPVRYDYFKLVRKWQVDLYRYDLRLTYAIVVDDPADRLLERYRELDRLESWLRTGSALDFTPDHLTRDSYKEYAARFSAQVEAPPDELVAVCWSRFIDGEAASGDADHAYSKLDATRVVVAIPEGYAYHAGDDVTPSGRFNYESDKSLEEIDVFAHVPRMAHQFSASPKSDGNPAEASPALTIYLDLLHTEELLLSGVVLFRLRDDHFARWQMDTFATIAKAAEQQFSNTRRELESRRAQLLEQLEHEDALTLRKLEREELMRSVIAHLFPSLDFNLGNTDENVAASGMMSLLHEAIEWENINYVLYPNFWGPDQDKALRFAIRHRDAFHEAFLRAGAAKVVLTIRPGFEEIFLAFASRVAEGASLNEAYAGVAQQLRDYHIAHGALDRTEHPNAEVTALSSTETEGTHLGRWFEFTPTSSLDVRIGGPVAAAGVADPMAYDPPKGWTSLLNFAGRMRELLDQLRGGSSGPGRGNG